MARSRHPDVPDEKGTRVRSEWRRFLALRHTGRKTGNLVVLLCGGMKEDQIPVGLVDCQAISTQAEKWREAIRGYLSR